MTAYRRRRCSDARVQELRIVSTLLSRLRFPEGLLVSFAIQLPPMVFQLSHPGAYVRVCSLQSGPRCRTLRCESVYSGETVGERGTHALPIFRAVGLNFWTSGWLWTCQSLISVKTRGNWGRKNNRKQWAHTGSRRIFHTCWRLRVEVRRWGERRGPGASPEVYVVEGMTPIYFGLRNCCKTA